MANALIKILKKILSIDEANQSKTLLENAKQDMENAKRLITINHERYWFEICRKDDDNDSGVKECFPNDS